MFFEKIINYLMIKILGEDAFTQDYEEEYKYTYSIDLDKNTNHVCEIYDFEKIRKEIKNGNTKRNSY